MTGNEKKIKRTCRKFSDDLQAIFDGMERAGKDDEYETSEICQLAVSAQNWAEDVAEAEA